MNSPSGLPYDWLLLRVRLYQDSNTIDQCCDLLILPCIIYPDFYLVCPGLICEHESIPNFIWDPQTFRRLKVLYSNCPDKFPQIRVLSLCQLK